MEHRVAENQVEGPIGEGKPLGVGDDGLDLDPQLVRVRLERPQHPRGDVGRRDPLDRPGVEQVQREIPRPGPDLERVPEGRRLAAERLLQLRGDLGTPGIGEVDPPLRVVRVGGEIVVPGVDVPDPLGAGVSSRWHGAEL